MCVEGGKVPYEPVMSEGEPSISTSNLVKKHRAENMELLSERGET
jgi:hypothetical protein